MGYIGVALALGSVVFNLALYATRAGVLRTVAACDLPDRLGVVDAVWSFAKECAALVAVILLIPISWCLPRCRSGAGTRGPLILVHGWGLNRGSLWWLRRRLVRDGWSPVCCLDYRSVTADVAGAALRLREMIERVGTSPPTRPSVTLIGHGLGGLVVRYYARRYPAARVRRIVTLGTRHRGTVLARGPLAVSRKLVPGSHFLKTLNAADRVPQQFDVIAIHSSFDATVLPPHHAEYPGAFNIQISDVGHNALLFSSKVYRLLAENLAAPLP